MQESPQPYSAPPSLPKSKSSRLAPESKRYRRFSSSITEHAQNPIDYLVLSGGGVKGIEYSGVHRALEQSGNLLGIKGIAGSSAGAITAAFLASGMNVNDFRKVISNTDINKLLGKSSFMMLKKDGLPLYQLIADTVKHNISSYVDSVDITQTAKERIDVLQDSLLETQDQLHNAEKEKKAIDSEIAKLNPLTEQPHRLREEIEEINKMIEALKSEKEKIEDLQYTELELKQNITKLGKIADGTSHEFTDLATRLKDQNGKIYFKDLALMRLLDPYKFKDLYVTAVEKKTGDLQIFSSMDSPNIEIAAACRASASLPVVLAPAVIDDKKYIDGGYKDNTPYNHFKKHTKLEIDEITLDQKKIQEAKAKGRTLALAFNNGPEFKALYSAEKNITGPDKVRSFLYNVVLKFVAKIGGKEKYTELEEERQRKIRDHSFETIALDPKGLKTTDFKKALKKADHLHYAGYLQTMEYLKNYGLSDQQSIAPHLHYQQFCMDVYDQLDKVKFRGGIPHTTDVGTKNAWLLKFCDPKTWVQKKGHLPTETLREYITVAATSRTNGQLTTSTTTVEAMLHVVNDRKTSNEIKKAFAEAIHKPITPTPDTKFSKKDIEKFLSRAETISLHNSHNGPATQFVKHAEERDRKPQTFVEKEKERRSLQSSSSLARNGTYANASLSRL